jgi:hypothetical protein
MTVYPALLLLSKRDRMTSSSYRTPATLAENRRGATLSMITAEDFFLFYVCFVVFVNRMENPGRYLALAIVT